MRRPGMEPRVALDRFEVLAIAARQQRKRCFKKDSLNNTSLALTKTFSLMDEKELEFRTEFLNLFNHPYFERPGDVFPSPTFGKIIDTQNKGRVVQFMLRFNF